MPCMGYTKNNVGEPKFGTLRPPSSPPQQMNELTVIVKVPNHLVQLSGDLRIKHQLACALYRVGIQNA